MVKTENKLVNRYELMLDIVTPNGSVISENYYEFMKRFEQNYLRGPKSPLASIDTFTTQYKNEDHFHALHQNFFACCREQFILLTSLNPDECFFISHIEYKPNYRPSEFTGEEIKKLDVIYGDNELLKEFLSNHTPKTEYNFSEIASIVWKFYRKITTSSDFLDFATQRISGMEKYKRYTDEDSRLLTQIQRCHRLYESGENKFAFNELDKIKRYKTLRAVTMILTEYENIPEYHANYYGKQM